jgi:Na+-transporting NADH:ubiquinone oxidoreductase subunit C
VQRSNGYIIVFTVILTVICAGLLAGVAVALKPEHTKQIELDTKSKILGAVMDIPEGADVLALYEKRVQSIVVNAQGEEVSGLVAENVNTLKEYKKKNLEDKLFPVFKIISDVNANQVDAYVVPLYGNGLWDLVWGFMAIDNDLITIKGAVFDHKGETPGLGAEIKQRYFMDDFTGESFLDGGAFKGITVAKGNNDPKNTDTSDNEVDALAGATITGDGVPVAPARASTSLSLVSVFFGSLLPLATVIPLKAPPSKKDSPVKSSIK